MTRSARKTSTRTASQGSLFKTLVTILAIILALNVVVLLVRVNDDMHHGYTTEYTEMARMVKQHDYPGLTNALTENETRGNKPQQDVLQYQLLANYYQAAQLEAAFEETGRTKSAAKQKAFREETAAQITQEDCVNAMADIDGVFGL